MAKQVQPAPNLAISISGTHLAALLHTNPQSLIRLAQAGVIRRGEDEEGRPLVGMYRLDQVLGDYCDYLRKEALGRGRHAFEEARAHNLQLKNTAAELKLKQTDGSLVSTAKLLQIVGSMCLLFPTKLTPARPRVVHTA